MDEAADSHKLVSHYGVCEGQGDEDRCQDREFRPDKGDRPTSVGATLRMTKGATAAEIPKTMVFSLSLITGESLPTYERTR